MSLGLDGRDLACGRLGAFVNIEATAGSRVDNHTPPYIQKATSPN